MNELQSLGAAEAARRIAAGTLTSEALVRACLERIGERDGDVMAWAAIDPDAAIREARAADQAPSRGPLHGVPFGVKDIIDTHDLPTEFNSPIYRGNRPRSDAACVALARAGGAVMLGKTVTTEFAYTHPSQTRNPHNLAHTPGGSSSGSAAAVADCMVPIAIGTQTGGSVLRPGSFCGVVAMKPSFGAINRAGVKPQSDSLDTVGVFARSVEDAGLFLHLLSGIPAPDFASLGFMTPALAVCRTPRWDKAEPAARDRFEETVKRLGDAGAVMSEYKFGRNFANVYDDQETLQMYEAVRALHFEYRNCRDQVSSTLLARLDPAMNHTRERYAMAVRRAADYRAWLAEDFGGFDAILTLSAPGEAPASLTTTGDAVFNRVWTMMGTPCVSLPMGAGPNGLPLGLQVVGPYGADNRTLMIAEWIRRAIG